MIHPEASSQPDGGPPSGPEVDLASTLAALKLRGDLELHEQEGNAATPYSVLEDVEHGKYYRLGPAEAAFLKCLMRQGGPQQPELIAAQVQQETGQAFQPQQMLQFCQWLEKTKLLEGQKTDTPAGGPKNLLSQLFFWRLPLCNPDEAMRWVANHFGFLFSWQVTAAIGAVLAVGLGIAFGHWTEFMQSYDGLFTSWRGIWLAMTWFFLKLIHESAHGAACRHYGGKVTEGGLAFILLVPIAYVDVSSCWRFSSRWQRLHVTLAGVLAELFVAGIAMVVWLYSDSLVVRNAMADLVLAASVTSLLFNLNPLLKFDGYFALADLSGIDNLYQYGQSYSRYFGSRYLLGLSKTVPKLPDRHTGWIKVYGVAASCWRFVTVSGMLTGAAIMFAGAGISLAIVGFVSFVVLPLIRLGTVLMEQSRAGQLSWARLTVRLTLIASSLVGILFLLPAKWQRTCPAIVEYDPPAVLHAPANGFVEELYVQDGDRVSAGQPILRLQNEELETDILRLRTRLAQAELKVRSARWTNDSSKLEEARSEASALQTQLEELQQQASQLLICAPHAGKVAVRSLPVLLGQYLEQGQEIGAVGSESSKRLKISIGDWEASRSQQWRDLPARISLPGSWSWSEKVSRIETRASEIPPDESLTALGGGSLAVRTKEGAEEPVLVEPRVNAFISLDENRSLRLHCGQRCAVRLGCWGQSLGHRLWEWAKETVTL